MYFREAYWLIPAMILLALLCVVGQMLVYVVVSMLFSPLTWGCVLLLILCCKFDKPQGG